MERRIPKQPRRVPLPHWQGPFERWSQKFAHKNHWRVRHVIGDDMQDSVQQCGVIFARVLDRYRHRNYDHKHLMAMFKTAVDNEFNSLANKDSRHRDVISDLPLDDDFQGAIEMDTRMLMSRLTFEQASSEAKSVLQMLMDAPAEILETLRDMLPITRNRKLYELAGLEDSGVPFDTELDDEIAAILN